MEEWPVKRPENGSGLTRGERFDPAVMSFHDGPRDCQPEPYSGTRRACRIGTIESFENVW